MEPSNSLLVVVINYVVGMFLEITAIPFILSILSSAQKELKILDKNTIPPIQRDTIAKILVQCIYSSLTIHQSDPQYFK